jgi:hypothetical protein
MKNAEKANIKDAFGDPEPFLETITDGRFLAFPKLLIMILQ